jgi:hypothetical protein
MIKSNDGNNRLSVASILSARTKQGMVNLSINGHDLQMDLDKTREVIGMLQAALEAAVSDTLLFAFLTTKVGLAPEQAAAALLDFRELRQGSRETVWPQ